MQDNYWFVFATLGEMNVKDVLQECQKQGWVPILVLRTEKETIVPFFDFQEVAIKFAKRNLPKNQIFGTTILTDNDMVKLNSEWIEEKKFKLEKFGHPRLIKNLGVFDVEVFEFKNKPDVYGVWGSSCKNSKILAKG